MKPLILNSTNCLGLILIRWHFVYKCIHWSSSWCYCLTGSTTPSTHSCAQKPFGWRYLFVIACIWVEGKCQGSLVTINTKTWMISIYILWGIKWWLAGWLTDPQNYRSPLFLINTPCNSSRNHVVTRYHWTIPYINLQSFDDCHSAAHVISVDKFKEKKMDIVT